MPRNLPFGERNFRDNSDLVLLTINGHITAKIIGLATNLYPLMEKLFLEDKNVALREGGPKHGKPIKLFPNAHCFLPQKKNYQSSTSGLTLIQIYHCEKGDC